jgi:hypothetical protein
MSCLAYFDADDAADGDGPLRESSHRQRTRLRKFDD